MRRVTAFSQVTLDGYLAGPNGDISWAHKEDPEWKAFVADNASGGGVLVFGRITYELMASHWPTPVALAQDPVVAERMNNLPKIVFSRTLEKASWHNTRLLKGDAAAQMRRLKQERGPDMAILGSGSIVTQLAQAGLIDQYQVVVNPVALGKGKAIFDGLRTRLDLRLTATRAFANGNVLLCYQPAG